MTVQSLGSYEINKVTNFKIKTLGGGIINTYMNCAKNENTKILLLAPGKGPMTYIRGIIEAIG